MYMLAVVLVLDLYVEWICDLCDRCVCAVGCGRQCQRLGAAGGWLLLHKWTLLAAAPRWHADAGVRLWWWSFRLHREVKHALWYHHRHQSGPRCLHPVWFLCLLLRHHLLLQYVPWHEHALLSLSWIEGLSSDRSSCVRSGGAGVLLGSGSHMDATGQGLFTHKSRLFFIHTAEITDVRYLQQVGPSYITHTTLCQVSTHPHYFPV